MKKLIALSACLLVAGSSIVFQGCSRKKRTITGAVVGAGVGVGIGAAAGGPVGMAVGGPVGAVTGGAVGYKSGSKKSKAKKMQNKNTANQQ